MKTYKHKILLMGDSNVGKTTMKSIIFTNNSFISKRSLNFTTFPPTNGIDNISIYFLDNIELCLWDCGGQDSFFQSYLSSEKETFFNKTDVLIFTFDINNITKLNEFSECIKNLMYFSPDAKIFVLFHKMDLIKNKDDREIIFKEKSNIIDELTDHNPNISYFCTSIWEDTLYKAWSKIVCSLMTNINTIDRYLKKFIEITDIDEVIVFEKNTFLDITHVVNTKKHDYCTNEDKNELMSMTLKMFKTSCIKQGSNINIINIKQHDISIILGKFTENTFIMIINSDSDIKYGAIKINLNVLKMCLKNTYF